ncbi:rod shape-determining protein MreD [Cyclonatronum proteinivorum]|uniref:Rod shape-determining protein MreD n=1 Tax=Cyclonatronum proteinivorum TaxID=1457365 RepID=A0A345UN02_9BACT|nr:rod shape-determining protein MreD [Cyclonatronum proteinivorum]AXJ01854.1 rod shape-determining protein MreD [Cyclonatronum proteinivorum]
MKQSLAIDLFIGLAAVLLQVMIFRHLELWGVTPDAGFLYILGLCAIRPRTYALLTGAAIAILLDIFLDTWGIHLFSFTLLILTTHSLIATQWENKLLIGQTFLLLLVLSAVYHLIFLLVASFAGIYDTSLLFLNFWLGSSLYTALVGIILYLLLID